MCEGFEKMYTTLFDMRLSKSLLFALLSVVTTALTNSSNETKELHKIVCYVSSWASNRAGQGKFVVEDVDPFLCTHLIYAFAKLAPDNRITSNYPHMDLKENWGEGVFQRFNSLKEKNPDLKTLISIGGWDEGSLKYSQMAASQVSRKTFINSCVDFIAEHGFNGLDFHWKYPAFRGGKPQDKQNFVSLIKELREAFQPHGYLLTAAVATQEQRIDMAYDIPALESYLDFINLLAYDFHGDWDKFAGHNSPLYARPNDYDHNKKLNVDYAVKYWLSNGCPANKLILGIPFFGRGFTLLNAKDNGLDASTGTGMTGVYTNEPGMMGYNEICQMLKDEEGWTKVTEPHILAPYAFKDRLWIGYDDMRSIHEKVQYLQKMKLGGAMAWSLDTDDFKGYCHGQRYPLLHAINEALNGRNETFTANSTEDPSTRPETVRNTAKPWFTFKLYAALHFPINNRDQGERQKEYEL